MYTVLPPVVNVPTGEIPEARLFTVRPRLLVMLPTFTSEEDEFSVNVREFENNAESLRALLLLSSEVTSE